MLLILIQEGLNQYYVKYRYYDFQNLIYVIICYRVQIVIGKINIVI